MLDRLIAFLFAAGVVAIPFDAIAGLKALGELSDESSFYFFALGIGLYGLKTVMGILDGRVDAPLGRHGIRCAAALLVGIIVISALWNASHISVARFHDRGGFAKLVTSAIVILYGLTLAWLVCVVVPRRWYSCLILPICFSAVLCLAFGALEALDHAGASVPVYKVLNAALHAGSDSDVQQWNGAVNLKVVFGWDQRLRTVSFEPPAFGNFTGLAWPWLLTSVLMTHKTRRAIHCILLVLFTVLIISSQARTGWLLLAADIASFGCLRLLFLPVSGRGHKLVIQLAGTGLLLAVVFAIGFYVANLDQMISAVVAGTSVSDLSRLAYQITAYKIFAASPFLGVGLGQFAFKAAAYMPAWGFLSPEIQPALLYAEAPWPNTYSLYARLVAELGLIGLVGWVAMWGTLIVNVYRAALVYASFGRPVPTIAYPIIMTSVALLATGLTTDTFRTPMMWICLGAGACFSARSRELARERARAQRVGYPLLAVHPYRQMP